MENNKLSSGDAVTIGSIISISSKDDADKEHTKIHEFGHYIQSRRSGPLWLLIFAIPSIIRAGYLGWRWSHGKSLNVDYENDFYTERNAIRNGRKYY